MANIDLGVSKEYIKEVLSCLFYFDRDFLGYTDMTEEAHLELCEFINDRHLEPGETEFKPFKLVLMPRFSFKTCAVTIGHSIQQILLNPNIRILVANELYANANDIATEIRGHFESNEVLRSVFGNWVGKKWREDCFTVSRRTKNLKEPTLSIAGIEVGKVSMHYDLIICDDLVSQNNITTKEQMDKVIQFYKLALSLLVPGGKMIVIGTRWDFNDLYNYLKEKEAHRFNFFERGAYNADGSLFFPQKLSHAFLEDQRKSQGSYVFACLYLNNPVDDSSAVFKKSQLRYYDVAGNFYRPDIELKGSEQEINYYTLADMNLYIHVDPAISEKSSGDYTGFIVSAIDPNGYVYVVYAKRERLDVFGMIARIFTLYSRYGGQANVRKVLLETQVFQKTLKFYFKEEMRKKGVHIPIEEITHTWQKSKKMRVRGLQPRFEDGTIFIGRDMPHLEDEFLRFPRGQHDDLIDALSFGLDWWRKPVIYQAKDIPEHSFLWYRNKMASGKKYPQYIGNEDIDEWRSLNEEFS